mmetsp:Transcript_27829/g.49130  ORF Transcript_27829/g.49130 Transcript_27829/m.49130 type:complete len:464 (-) Transcript_27829:135-1526(-)|eukprot:CAMPEP_0197518462 /NCGR_PEP_ID=MMETSP1318-20131121/3668_1 /TAXON_ID=552666 /ORGANISM="Partenskyella glossopodia, Strain RCC365" /LENGTH=463 /DNA_ID=CAMNT_0043068825 /DNA_START=413 /DNA_END=1804 /DNA_ORIENTATION=+
MEGMHEAKSAKTKTSSAKQMLANTPQLTREVSECGPDTDRFVRLLKWLRNGGSLFPKLYLKYIDEDFRAVHTKEAVPTNTEVVYVPLSQIMTTEKAKASDIGRAIKASGYYMNCSHSWLACYLCQEKHASSSYWKPFIDILPDKYYNMPIFFNDHYNKHLKGSYSIEMAATRNKQLRQEYEGIVRACPAFRKYHYLEFVWGRLAVITRIFSLDINGRTTDGLVPMADMLNHHPTRQTTWGYSDRKQGFVMTTTQEVGPDVEIFDSYGRKWQGRYFVNYGFTIDDNYEDNDAVIQGHLSEKDQFYVQKCRYLGGLTSREFQPQAQWGRKAKEMMSYFRTIAATYQELRNHRNFHAPLSIRNEMAALTELEKACQVALAKFPDSLTHDHKLLKANQWEDSNHRNCVIMRAGEKEVLWWFISLARQGRELLSMPYAKHAKNVPSKKDRLMAYYNAVIEPLAKQAYR